MAITAGLKVPLGLITGVVLAVGAEVVLGLAFDVLGFALDVLSKSGNVTFLQCQKYLTNRILQLIYNTWHQVVNWWHSRPILMNSKVKAGMLTAVTMDVQFSFICYFFIHCYSCYVN